MRINKNIFQSFSKSCYTMPSPSAYPTEQSGRASPYRRKKEGIIVKNQITSFSAGATLALSAYLITALAAGETYSRLFAGLKILFGTCDGG